MKFEVRNRYLGEVKFVAEIDCLEGEQFSVKLGFAVKWAIKNNANLFNADLSNADLSNANLSNANLSNAKNAELPLARTRILPEGDLIGWKKCAGNTIVKVRVPEAARRSHAFSRKCRAEFVDVLEIIGAEQAVSSHDNLTVYKVGKRVVADHFDEDWAKECSGGIHFFITKIEAENY